ncbi:MAG: hypothetical protein IJR85_08810 [Synergistaceae bacterium]|nr:hypothetical protein [Synergistaceae bacterium]
MSKAAPEPPEPGLSGTAGKIAGAIGGAIIGGLTGNKIGTEIDRKD